MKNQNTSQLPSLNTQYSILNPKLSLVCAMSQNRVIGFHNKLPWHLPADLRHFKELTLHKPVIMGRKTYDSIGKALPNRRNIIITRNQNLVIPNCEITHSLHDALCLTQNDTEVMIIGGENIFAQAMPLANRMYLTIIKQDFEGDAFFPQWPEEKWQLVETIDHVPDNINPFYYSFLTLIRMD